MNMMQMLTAAGPYYIMGFIITFFTLMSSRYTLGYDIHPQRKFLRIMFVSLLWFASLVISAMIVYFKRGEDLAIHDDEKDAMRLEIEQLRANQEQHAEDAALKPAQHFDEEEFVPEAPQKKRMTW